MEDDPQAISMNNLSIDDDNQFNNPDAEPLLNKSQSKVAANKSSSALISQPQIFCCRKSNEMQPRNIVFTGREVYVEPQGKYPPNVVRNQKYSILTFFPLVLYNQFKFFFNFYFLAVALTQFVPVLKVGLLFTYVAPLAFVLTVTMLKEAYDDIQRWNRDRNANSEVYDVLVNDSVYEQHGKAVVPIESPHDIVAETKSIASSDIHVGDIVVLHSGSRVPADMILLRTHDASGSVFIKTDQLDGETDWKLRKAVPTFQGLVSDQMIYDISGEFYVSEPIKEIYEFEGKFETEDGRTVDPLGLENTLWANTVIASGTVYGLVTYAGKETRSVMNANKPVSKVGKTDWELNSLSKLLFLLTLLLSLVMIILKGFTGLWYLSLFRFMLLFSSIIPISLRVNLDLAKTWYSVQIMRDKLILDTVVRTSTIPEELGRVSYLFSDKTGTLTQNVMEFKKLVLRRPYLYSRDKPDEIRFRLETGFRVEEPDEKVELSEEDLAGVELLNSIRALALCHNVTPVFDEEIKERTYQAASPDEVALVKFSEDIGLTLEERSEKLIVLRRDDDSIERFQVLNIFPFTSATKRMGIIVRSEATDEIWFYIKGAESVLKTMVIANDWLEEECESLAREGLRTLVFGRRQLTEEQYQDFLERYNHARALMKNRKAQERAVIQSMEVDFELLCLSGVEDRLQDGVRTCLENLRNAGIKIWMLTGDKDETAKCIARSARLVDHTMEIFSITARNRAEARANLDTFGYTVGAALLVDGEALKICLEHCRTQFLECTSDAPAVICCRCSPTQKAEVVELMKVYSGKICCAIGDGGNDVSMIQASHVGIGIVGKEGKQASLAADFSVNQFSFIQRLILWHGMNSYSRSARLSQFIMHRGTIISIIQAVFSSLFFYVTVPIYTGYLLVGYATVFTMLPVFSLVLDEDVSETAIKRFPEIYHKSIAQKPLSYRTFFIWMAQSIFQGGVIMVVGILLFEDQFVYVVSITFTSLILTELLNIAFEVQRWHYFIGLSIAGSLLCYLVSMFVLRGYFDITYIKTLSFVWRVCVVTACSCAPVLLYKYAARRIDPAMGKRVQI